MKHSRLSHSLDFGKEWYGIPCSAEYWNDVNSIFEDLKEKKTNGLKWNKLQSKENDVYIPLLNAFINEIKRVNSIAPCMSRTLVEYLIGVNDYYKVVSRDSERITLVQTFNMHGTLNKPSKTKVSIITVPLVELPTRIVALEFKEGSNNTVEMYLDNGWELSFRIHNASTIVEPSLKFDIQFIGMPPSILSFNCSWQ